MWVNIDLFPLVDPPIGGSSHAGSSHAGSSLGWIHRARKKKKSIFFFYPIRSDYMMLNKIILLCLDLNLI